MSDLLEQTRPLQIQFTHDREGVRRATDWVKERIDDYRDVGHVLYEVFHHELWRHLGYKNFNAYCQQEFGITGHAATQSIVESAKVVEEAITKSNGKLSGKLESTRPEQDSPPRPPPKHPEQITPVKVEVKQVEPPPPPKPAAKKSNVVDYGVDEFDQKVHYAKAREYLDVAADLRIARKALADLAKQIDAAGKKISPYHDRVKGQIAESISGLRRALDYMTCTRVCPICNSLGGTCRACVTCGVMSAIQHKQYLESQG